MEAFNIILFMFAYMCKYSCIYVQILCIYYTYLHKLWNMVNIIDLAGIYLLKFSEGNSRTMCEICSDLTVTRPE